MYDYASREKKAYRIIKTLGEYFGEEKLSALTVLDVGASTGIIDNILSKKFKKVVGTDIDEEAINYAKRTFKRKKLEFRIGDAMNLMFKNNSFDVVICTQVYEHVSNQNKLFSEVYRVLKPGGVCYLAALNKLRIWEPHYNLPFLSWLPKNFANLYLRFVGRGNVYFETLRTYWELQTMNKKFEIIDLTREIIRNPKKYGYEDAIPSNPLLFVPLQAISPFYKFFTPTFFWLLVKPSNKSKEKKFDINWTPTPTFLYRTYLYKKIIKNFPRNYFFLDVGTGNGVLLNFLIESGFEGEAIEFAKRQLGNKRAEIVKFQDLFKYNSKRLYDFILCFETLEHIEDDLGAMKKISTLLKPGGPFVLSVPALKAAWSKIDELKGHFRRYKKEELRERLVQSGFRVQEIYSYGFPRFGLQEK